MLYCNVNVDYIKCYYIVKDDYIGFINSSNGTLVSKNSLQIKIREALATQCYRRSKKLQMLEEDGFCPNILNLERD